MKLLTILSICLISFFSIGGCATTSNYVTPENAKVAASLVATNTLAFAVNDKDRENVANYVYSIAHAIRTLSGGHVPTPNELSDTIGLFAPKLTKYSVLGTNIAGVYGGVFNQIKGDPKVALQYLEAIASGCEDAATAYVKIAPPTPTP